MSLRDGRVASSGQTKPSRAPSNAGALIGGLGRRFCAGSGALGCRGTGCGGEACRRDGNFDLARAPADRGRPLPRNLGFGGIAKIIGDRRDRAFLLLRTTAPTPTTAPSAPAIAPVAFAALAVEFGRVFALARRLAGLRLVGGKRWRDALRRMATCSRGSPPRPPRRRRRRLRR